MTGNIAVRRRRTKKPGADAPTQGITDILNSEETARSLAKIRKEMSHFHQRQRIIRWASVLPLCIGSLVLAVQGLSRSSGAVVGCLIAIALVLGNFNRVRSALVRAGAIEADSSLTPCATLLSVLAHRLAPHVRALHTWSSPRPGLVAKLDGGKLLLITQEGNFLPTILRPEEIDFAITKNAYLANTVQDSRMANRREWILSLGYHTVHSGRSFASVIGFTDNEGRIFEWHNDFLALLAAAKYWPDVAVNM